jgi:hypothetical protein
MADANCKFVEMQKTYADIDTDSDIIILLYDANLSTDIKV